MKIFKRNDLLVQVLAFPAVYTQFSVNIKAQQGHVLFTLTRNDARLWHVEYLNQKEWFALLALTSEEANA